MKPKKPAPCWLWVNFAGVPMEMHTGKDRETRIWRRLHGRLVLYVPAKRPVKGYGDAVSFQLRPANFPLGTEKGS